MTFNTDHQIIARYNKKYKKIYRLNIPIKVKISSNDYKNAFNIDYKYIPFQKGIGIDLYDLEENEITNKRIDLLKNNEFIVYTWFRIDSSFTIQKKFQNQIRKAVIENKDTLHIGTVSEFKAKHPILFEKLTKNDSISVRLLEDGKLGKRITVPVKW